LEMMIVDDRTLDVRPVADRLMEVAGGEPGASDVERGPVAWSNELALHVLELKTNGPAPDLTGLTGAFQQNVDEASDLLADMGCRLLPGGMHPWMDPVAELRLWPHEYNEVYRAFDRIFSCRGHGWANLQSTHVNLPFRGDDEFHRLHEAIRLVLPLIPALAASSPFLEGAAGPALDNRLLAYRDNARRVPSVTGRVVPERVGGRAEYRAAILERIYQDLEPLDPQGILRAEWVNARGAIARFGRGAIEIRVIDAQECPLADVAVVAAVTAAVRRLADGPLAAGEPADVPDDDLVGLLERTIHRGGAALLESHRHLDLLSLPSGRALAVRDVWARVVEDGRPDRGGGAPWRAALETILERGTLAERLRVAAGLDAVPDGDGRGGSVPRPRLRAVYGELSACLARGEVFIGT
ncbi:MAG TPA: glutamate-cysteine ligase family protein, partial [Longimicrobiales bacterium]|nr:glutamate-cysteine ligase family protein [Longimicrobiales bacterium]